MKKLPKKRLLKRPKNNFQNHKEPIKLIGSFLCNFILNIKKVLQNYLLLVIIIIKFMQIAQKRKNYGKRTFKNYKRYKRKNFN